MLSEEAVRRNCVLVYELLDEVVDNGFPQSTSSEALKEYVLNEPVMVKSAVRPRALLPPRAVHKRVSQLSLRRNTLQVGLTKSMSWSVVKEGSVDGPRGALGATTRATLISPRPVNTF